MTRAYWYSVSRSQITLPLLVAAFVVPTGTTMSTAMTTPTTAPAQPLPAEARDGGEREGEREQQEGAVGADTGISSSAARKVPVSEPIVPMA